MRCTACTRVWKHRQDSSTKRWRNISRVQREEHRKSILERFGRSEEGHPTHCKHRRRLARLRRRLREEEELWPLLDLLLLARRLWLLLPSITLLASVPSALPFWLPAIPSAPALRVPLASSTLIACLRRRISAAMAGPDGAAVEQQQEATDEAGRRLAPPLLELLLPRSAVVEEVAAVLLPPLVAIRRRLANPQTATVSMDSAAIFNRAIAMSNSNAPDTKVVVVAAAPVFPQLPLHSSRLLQLRLATAAAEMAAVIPLGATIPTLLVEAGAVLISPRSRATNVSSRDTMRRRVRH